MDECPDGPERCERTGVSERWSVSGFEVLHLVEGGSAGDLWCARDLERGELVALRRVGSGADAGALRRSLAAQADLPCAVRLRDVVDDGSVLVLVLDHAEGGVLERLLDRRGSLEPGEVVTVGVPLALALAAGVERGLGHGELTATSVWFGADGRPLLAGLGLSGAAVDPADDVAALATLCLGMLRPSHDPSPQVAALVEVLEQARSRDPAARPSAAQLAGMLRRAHPPAPVRLHGGGGGGGGGAGGGGGGRGARHARPAPDAPGRGRSPGRLLVAALVLLVICGAGAGWWSGRGGEAPVPAAAGVTAATRAAVEGAPDWTAELDRLDELRGEAFAAADAQVLGQVYAPGSAALAADRHLVDELAAAGRTASGVRHLLGEVAVVAVDGDRARLRVVDALGPYEVRDRTGRLVARVAGRGERRQLVELARTAQGWRLVSVAPT